ncbi:hypothetical protein SOV_28360 [Sporomusa ovata DSM 2662]|uniref:Uncharacterized protein n=1 Tax=Sporomusa ovata TaxID=2378 RepID=A0A0U1L1B9_9FIRM|nr:hypothetical protein [Sporomusa ovata]EQB24536.1 hypothetical protein SOV_7c00200 [Sporomusa ovata DSM 2662]CQR73476.1 hypothetical protein SpAn4DRAFT_5137 [Sporomusa ovata]
MTDPLKMQNEIERLWAVIKLAKEYREARNRKPTKGREQEIYEKGKALDIALAELNKSVECRWELTAKSSRLYQQYPARNNLAKKILG